MSADSLFSIVAPAPVPVATAKAADARGDSGFDRMLGEVVEADTERARPVGKNDTDLTRAGLNPPQPSSGPMAMAATAEDVALDPAVDVAPPAPALAAAVTPGAVSALPVSDDGETTDDAGVAPVLAPDKGADTPQVLPGTAAAAVPPHIRTGTAPPPIEAKGPTGPQVLPGTDDEARPPEPVVSAKGTDVPQVLPGTSGKASMNEGPEILPGVTPDRVDNKSTDRQILPGVVPGPAAVKPLDRQVLPGTETPPKTAIAAEPTNPATPATPESAAVAAAGTRSTAAVMAALAPTVAPPPVRPLTDRTGTVSNSARATGDGTQGSSSVAAGAPGSAATVATAAVSGTPTTSGATSLSDRPLTPATAVPVPAVTAAPDSSVKSAVDQAPVETPPAPVSQTGTAAQNYSLSNLSSAAVEATAQIAAQIIRRMDARSTRFEMALTPDNLGRVDVSLDIDEHGRLAARLAFDNPAAALDMKGRVDDLRRQLEDAGFHLGDDAFQFAERDRSSGEAFDRRQGRAFAAAARLSDETDAAAPVPARWMSLSLTPDRVDMKV